MYVKIVMLKKLPGGFTKKVYFQEGYVFAIQSLFDCENIKDLWTYLTDWLTPWIWNLGK